MLDFQRISEFPYWGLRPQHDDVQNVWPAYIIRKGFFLSGLFLAASLVISVWACAAPAAFPLLRHYAAFAQTASVIVLSATLPGALLLEDILRKTQS